MTVSSDLLICLPFSFCSGCSLSGLPTPYCTVSRFRLTNEFSVCTVGSDFIEWTRAAASLSTGMMMI